MFGFDELEAMELKSADRYKVRIMKFRRRGDRFPRLTHHFWWLVHNWAAHFAIGLVPIKPCFRFHDWTSKKLNAGR